VIGTAGRWLKDREMVEAVAGYWEAIGLKPKVRIFEFNMVFLVYGPTG
jgi:peptide/nickel transport system substrate-binding protein